MKCCNHNCDQGDTCPARNSPTEQQNEALGPWEGLLLYGFIAVCGASTVAVGLGMLGYLYIRFWA